MSDDKTKYYLVIREVVVKASSKSDAKLQALKADPISETADILRASEAKELLNDN